MLTDGFMRIKYKRLVYAVIVLIFAFAWINPGMQMPESDVVNSYNKHISADMAVMSETAKKFGINYRIGDHLEQGAIVMYLKFPEKFSEKEKNRILRETANKIAKRLSQTNDYEEYRETKVDGEITFEMGTIIRKTVAKKAFIQTVSLSPVLYEAINRTNFSVQGTTLHCKVFCYPLLTKSIIRKPPYSHTLSFGFLDLNIQKSPFKSRYIIADFIPTEIYTFKLFGLHLSGNIRYHPGESGISRLMNFESLRQVGGN